jgi:hypothetical protein
MAMDSIRELLEQKAGVLNDHIKDDRALAQQEISRHFGDQATVRDLKNGFLTITTRSAPIASEIRMQQMLLLEALQGHTKEPIERLRILIR